ncbi:MAG: C40 family peptidase [Clostridia bacterium]|nr:C40 family peptidase [Clostridia bacterium]
MNRYRKAFSFLGAVFLLCLWGCTESTPEVALAAVETAAPTAQATHAVVVLDVPPTPVPTPTPEPTPEPTPTPVPTPTATPTSMPMDRRSFHEEVETVLFPLWLQEQTQTPTPAPYASPDPNAQNVGKLGAMTFASVPVYEKPRETAQVLGRESYHLVYIQGIEKDFYQVTTQQGLSGYIKCSQCVGLTEGEVEVYLSAAMEQGYTANAYSPEAFVELVQLLPVSGPMEEHIYAALCRLGLDFEPYYYRLFQKDLADETRYPLYYKDETYNSLLFRLFNSTGSLVYYQGQPTQWEYVAAPGQLQLGDILFFAELPKRSTGVMEECEFVVAGRHSGMLTDCGVYLGEDRVLLLQEGRVEAVEHFSETELYKSFDSARRIHTGIFDDKQYIIENLIAQEYECLGTPYSNFQRTGDYSFDCSGIICWCLGRMELYPTAYVHYHFTETSASGLSNINDYIWQGRKRVKMSVPVPREEGVESLDGFERGDIVFLLGSKGGKIGHVMVYLGDGRVIHSTYITKKYSGTVVANFRPALQKLYYTSLRIDSVEEMER